MSIPCRFVCFTFYIGYLIDIVSSSFDVTESLKTVTNKQSPHSSPSSVKSTRRTRPRPLDQALQSDRPHVLTYGGSRSSTTRPNQSTSILVQSLSVKSTQEIVDRRFLAFDFDPIFPVYTSSSFDHFYSKDLQQNEGRDLTESFLRETLFVQMYDNANKHSDKSKDNSDILLKDTSGIKSVHKEVEESVITHEQTLSDDIIAIYNHDETILVEENRNDLSGEIIDSQINHGYDDVREEIMNKEDRDMDIDIDRHEIDFSEETNEGTSGEASSIDASNLTPLSTANQLGSNVDVEEFRTDSSFNTNSANFSTDQDTIIQQQLITETNRGDGTINIHDVGTEEIKIFEMAWTDIEKMTKFEIDIPVIDTDVLSETNFTGDKSTSELDDKEHEIDGMSPKTHIDENGVLRPPSHLIHNDSSYDLVIDLLEEKDLIPFPSSDSEAKITETGNSYEATYTTVISSEVNSTEDTDTLSSNKTTTTDVYNIVQPNNAAATINTANHDFVYGLDDFHKFLEEVDPPDELDVGASGYSIQEILMGQGTKIVKARIKKGIQHLNEIRVKVISALTGNRAGERNGVQFDTETMALSPIINDGENPLITIMRQPKEHIHRLKTVLEDAVAHIEDNLQKLILFWDKITNNNRRELFDDEDETSFDRDIAELKKKLDENRMRQRRSVTDSTGADDLLNDFEAVG